ncbi:HK97 family phage prohead protease [Cupriavidus sp. AcVe19-6a]|uniref:HK97 family phage prohead protease n=1 Tax=Cupriavidus sp. AcVe19-6a TaxID=2821358 RepID=UPI001AEA9E95|nr:HK97 family phage prohead protease [Cupriavidus sp. AcVe19-6a]MBP0634905.1 HK97 family phage prohead protease [Cupriavidus sp. AcVe19-6a]
MKQKDAVMKRRDFDFEVKSINSSGLFTGYASVFNVRDSYGEIVVPGAFADSLTKLEASGRKLPALWQHRSGEPIGVYDKVYEDGNGLFVEGRLLIGKVQRATEAHALMEAGAVTGLSIGFMTIDEEFDATARSWMLLKLDLIEVSPVTFPANEEARIEEIKGKLRARVPISIREFERFLRDEGNYSRAEAEAIASRGFGSVASRDETADAVTKGIADLLAHFRK